MKCNTRTALKHVLWGRDMLSCTNLLHSRPKPSFGQQVQLTREHSSNLIHFIHAMPIHASLMWNAPVHIIDRPAHCDFSLRPLPLLPRTPLAPPPAPPGPLHDRSRCLLQQALPGHPPRPLAPREYSRHRSHRLAPLAAELHRWSPGRRAAHHRSLPPLDQIVSWWWTQSAEQIRTQLVRDDCSSHCSNGSSSEPCSDHAAFTIFLLVMLTVAV
jgi:hypothetical protein